MVLSNDRIFAYLHGLAMFLAWGVLGTVSIVSARRRTKTDKWFPWHWVVALCTVILSVAGLVFAIGGKNWALITWDWDHKFIGVFIVSAACLQALTGLMAHCLWNPSAHRTTLLEYFHAIIGRGTWLVSIYQMYTGVSALASEQDWDAATRTGVVGAYIFYMGLCLSLFVFADVSGHDSSKAAAPNGYSGQLQNVSEEFA